MSNYEKLAQLRAKTDRELSVLIQRELNRALTLADMAENSESQSHSEAEQSYRLLEALLPRTAQTLSGKRGGIEGQMRNLRRMLDRAPAARRALPRQASSGAG